jgi:hypothetical protein
MAGSYDRQPGRAGGAPGQGGYTSSRAFDHPGKRTLAQHGPELGGRGAPVQREDDAKTHPIPDGDHVWQYGPQADPDRLNDCGPACVLMALRAMGLERQLIAAMPADYQPVTEQNEMNFIRFVGFGKVLSGALTPAQIQSCLTKVLARLGVPLPEDPASLFPMLRGPDGNPFYTNTNKQEVARGTPLAQSRAGQFIQASCVDGSAVMVLGHPEGGPWGWGGGEEPERARNVEDQGDHFVLVWRPDQQQDLYTVMDPSWAAPRHDKPLADVVEFMYARGGRQSTVMNMIAIPYKKIADLVPASSLYNVRDLFGDRSGAPVG